MTLKLAVIVGLMLLAARATAQEGFQYTYCYSMEYRGANNHFVFSTPFPAPDKYLPGESVEQRDARIRNLYAQASSEYLRYLEARNIGDLHHDPDCYQIGAFLPGDAGSVEQAIDAARSKMSFISSNNRGDEPTYTDFVPSWAGPIKGELNPEPENDHRPAILLDNGPTPAEEAAARKAKEDAGIAKANAQAKYANALQQHFDAQLTQEALEIRQQVDSVRRDYDRRQAACKAGDADNCYAKTSAQ